MNITLNLNPNHIEFIQYKLDDKNSLKFTFDTESSDVCPKIEIVTSTSKIKLDEDKKKQTATKVKKEFYDILKKADSFTEKKNLSPTTTIVTKPHKLIQKTKLVRDDIKAQIEDLMDTNIDHKDERILELRLRLMNYEFSNCNTKEECDYLLNKYAGTNLHYESKVEYNRKMEELYQECEDAILNKKIENTPLDITPLDLPPIFHNAFNEPKSEDKEQSKWVNPNSPEAMKLCKKKSRPSQRFEDVVAEKYQKLDNPK